MKFNIFRKENKLLNCFNVEKYIEYILLDMFNILKNKEQAVEFVSNELIFGKKSSLEVRNFLKSSELDLKGEPKILPLDSPNIIFNNKITKIGSYHSTITIRLKIIEKIMREYEVGCYDDKERKKKIKEYCKERGIKELIHFTELKNVKSILDIGLNSKDYNSELHKKHKINDINRFDYRTHMISLSVSHPNYKMFYKYRQQNKNSNWAVLIIEPDVLWEIHCLFCKKNAASIDISSAEDKELMSLKGLKSMFSEDNFLPSNFTTDSQAEVLVWEHIPIKYIKSVVVQNKIAADILELDSIESNIDSFYYSNRNYALNNRR